MRDAITGIAVVFVITGLAFVGLDVAEEIDSRFTFSGSTTVGYIGAILLIAGLTAMLFVILFSLDERRNTRW